MKKKKQRQMQRQSQVNQPKKETLTLGDQLNDFPSKVTFT
jgi:predicted secreted acid phosphatase